MTSLFDTHCHLLNLPELEKELVYASQHSVQNFLNMSVQPSEWVENIALSRKFPNIFSALGIHPWYVNQHFHKDLDVLSSLIEQFSPCVLGEIGLDFMPQYKHARAQQLVVFEAQIEMACQNSLPVSIHCRKAFNELFHLINNRDLRGVLHGFSGGAELGRRFVDLGFKLGVNTVILNSNARRYHNLIKYVGLDALVLETDAPYGHLSPNGYYLQALNSVALKVAELLNCELEQVALQTTLNAKEVFNIC